jgi:hypothetical protein
MYKSKAKTLAFKNKYSEAQLLNHSVISYVNLWYRKDRRHVAKAKENKAEKLWPTLHKICGRL